MLVCFERHLHTGTRNTESNVRYRNTQNAQQGVQRGHVRDKRRAHVRNKPKNEPVPRLDLGLGLGLSLDPA
eukprot:1733588-Rhodomonas_salina.3